MHNSRILVSLAALALVSCGGGDSSFATIGTPAGTTAAPTVASVLLVSDVATIPSDSSSSATVSAYVRDANNQFLAGIPVMVTASSGGLTPVLTGTGSAGVTDATGTVKYSLNAFNNPVNRTITVTATAGTITSTLNVGVTGSTLAVQGASSLTAGQTQTYTVTLNNSAAKGIAGAAITVTPPSNGTVSSTALTTDVSGHATFTVTGTTGGAGTITVSGQGLTATAAVTVASAAVSFNTPAANAQIALGTLQTVTVTWTNNGTPVAGQPVAFATTRGCINPAAPTNTCIISAGPPQTLKPSTATVTTNAQGQASVQVLSDNAGPANVTATITGGTASSLPLQFVATNPAVIDVQASVFTLAPAEQSTISAIVRDVNNNLVANATVSFNLTDTSGGSISVPSATTDLQGRAQTVYTAGSVPSASGGVQITASVPSVPAVTPKTVALTVARRQVFISMGTGNVIVQNATATQYEKDYIVQVTDSTGAGVSGVPLAMSVLSNYYYKGFRQGLGTVWVTCYTVPGPGSTCTGSAAPAPVHGNGCLDEDLNRNGILDPANPATGALSEDINGNGRIDAGNIALVSPTSVTTDGSGFATVKVFYPEEYAYYLEVTLQAKAQVQGTAFFAQSIFLLPGLAADFNDLTKSPPGIVSPFGTANVCTSPN